MQRRVIIVIATVRKRFDENKRSTIVKVWKMKLAFLDRIKSESYSKSKGIESSVYPT